MITVLTREDLNYDLDDILDLRIYGSFNETLTREVIIKSTFIVFIDDDRRFEILKNIYPDDSSETYKILDILKLN